LKTAIKLDPKTSIAYLVIGDLYRRKGEFLLALEHYSKYVALEPTDEYGYRMRSSVFRSLGKDADAELDAAKAESLAKKPGVSGN
jgi:tetratricopeptide (TPR) repeat protein